MTTIEARYKRGDQIQGVYEVYDVISTPTTEIYFCFHRPSMLPYALKTLRAELVTYDIRKSLYKEVANWLSVKLHPNIVYCFGVNELDFRPYIVLEWLSVSGVYVTNYDNWLKERPVTLREKISNRQLEPLNMLKASIDIARALEHLASIQPSVVHCDLKPENILIAPYIELGSEGTAKLIDFGAAQVTGSIHHMGGTPAYMAPEQWNNESLTPKTDIYAFGCLVYEMFTGVPPFAGVSRAELRSHHLNSIIPHHTFDFDGLSSLIYGCLEKDPGQRLDATQVRFQLEEILQKSTGSSYRELRISNLTEGQIARRVSAFEEIGEYQTALREINILLELHTNDPIYLIKRANIFVELKQFADALNDLGKAIEFDAGRAFGFGQRANLFYRLKRLDDALNDISQAVSLEPKIAEYHRLKGNILDELEHYDEAIQEYKRALELDPKDVLTLMERSITLNNTGNWAEALHDISTAIDISPSDPVAYTTRGDLFRKLKRFDEAIGDLSRVIELAPENAQYFANRATVFDDMKDFESSRDDWKQASILDPENAMYFAGLSFALYSLHQLDEALETVNRALTIDPRNISALNAGALIYESMKRFDDAVANYEVAINQAPRQINLHFNRGKCYVLLGNYDAAIADFSAEIELSPTDAAAYDWRGMVYEIKDDVNAALADYTRAVQLDPSKSDYQADRANALRLLGSNSIFITSIISQSSLLSNNDVADSHLQIYTNRIKDNPNDTDALNKCGDIYRIRGNIPHALKYYGLAVTVDPSNAYAYYGRGCCYELLGNYPEAIKNYEESLKIQANDYVFISIAQCYIYLEQPELAADASQKALTLTPQNTQALLTLGHALILSNRVVETIEVLNRLILIDPTNSEAFRFRATVHRHLGELEKATEDIKHALSLNPKNSSFFLEQGKIYEKQELREQALESYNQAIELNAMDEESYSARGGLYFIQERFERALADYTRAIELCSYEDALLYHSRGLCFNKLSRLEEARSDFSKTIQLKPDFVPAYFDLGVIYYKLKRSDEAKRLYETVLHLDPSFTMALVNLAVVYIDEKLFLKAYKFLEEAITQGDLDALQKKRYLKRQWLTAPELGSQDELTRVASELWHIVDTFDEMLALVKLYPFLLDDEYIHFLEQAVGIMFLEEIKTSQLANQYREKLIWLRQLQQSGIRKLANGYVEAFLLRATLSERQGEYQEAIINYTRALEIEPDSIFSLSRRAMWYDLLGKYAAAVEDYSHAIQQQPDQVELYSDRADTYNNLGEFEKAIQDCDHAISLDSQHVLAYGNRGFAYVWLGQYPKVLNNALTAIQSVPNNALLLNNVGYAHHLLGNLKLAEKYYSEACRIQRDFVLGLINLGNVYADSEEAEISKRFYEYVLEYEPENYYMLLALGCLYTSIGLPTLGLYHFEDANNLKKELLTDYYLIWGEHQIERNDDKRFGKAIVAISGAIAIEEVQAAVQTYPFITHEYFRRHLIRLAARMPGMYAIGDDDSYPRLKWLAEVAETLNKNTHSPYYQVDLPEKTLPSTSTTLANFFFQKGIGDLEKKLYHRAKIAFDRALEMYARNPDYAIFRAVANIMLGQASQAEDDLNIAFQIDPNSNEYFLELYRTLIAHCVMRDLTHE